MTVSVVATSSQFTALLYNMESKPPQSKVNPPLQSISNGQVRRRDPLFESKPRAYYPDYTVTFPMA